MPSEVQPLELVILVGIQASGKTTFFRRHLAERHVHVSLDNWRGKGGVRRREHEAILAGLHEAAGSGGRLRGVVVDNTNTTAATRQRYFDCARRFSAETRLPVRVRAYFFDADLEGCLARNAARPADAAVGTPYYVPPVAIRAFAARLQPPAREEGFDEILRVRIAGEGQFQVEPVGPDGQADT